MFNKPTSVTNRIGSICVMSPKVAKVSTASPVASILPIVFRKLTLNNKTLYKFYVSDSYKHVSLLCTKNISLWKKWFTVEVSSFQAKIEKV